jgi:glutathione synthase/RimK-type ligase-like ATP-grasp enzyme
MRIALMFEEDWETAPRIVRLFVDAGCEPAVNPAWGELDSFDLGMVRANFWEPGLADMLAKGLFIAAGGAPLLNSILAILSCADKVVSGELMRAAGLNVPATWIPRKGESLPERDHGWVVKPRFGSHQRGVEVFVDRDDAQRYLDSRSSERVVQERIIGRYWRIIATPERAVRTYAMPMDSRGVTALPKGALREVVDDASPDLQRVGTAMVQALGGSVLGVDVIEDGEGRYWALEGNTGFGFNLGDAQVEHAILDEAYALVNAAARPAA